MNLISVLVMIHFQLAFEIPILLLFADHPVVALVPAAKTDRPVGATTGSAKEVWRVRVETFAMELVCEILELQIC